MIAISNKDIDAGKEFDWGRTSAEYAKYRDVYPKEFYDKIVNLGLCIRGQNVLDLGTGTGVLPRNMYQYGAAFIGTDISENQIIQAQLLTNESGMKIDYFVSSAEDIDFPEKTFDVITACQCFFYFDHSVLSSKIAKILKPNGKLAILYMAWLPKEDKIAAASEELISKYNPVWSGAGETRHPILIPNVYDDRFELEESLLFDLKVPFTKESWHGRIKTCRGIGASLSNEQIEQFEGEHKALLNEIAPDNFNILHYVAISVLKVKK